MTVALVLALGATAALLCYGLLAWERIIARRRAQEPGST
jgi:hypothetical protein